jgi:hypothetical protein
MDQHKVYARSIVTCYLIGAGVNIINSAYNTIHPVAFIPTIEDKAKTTEG